MTVEAPSSQTRLKLDGYAKAVLSYVGEDGYPMSIPCEFELDDTEESLLLTPTATPSYLQSGSRVTVIFSHIRPIEGVGYVDRRYVTVEGVLREKHETFEVSIERVRGWDESVVPFFEYCERSVSRGRSYLESLSKSHGRPVTPRLSLPWKILLATRAPFLSATVIPVALGAAVALWQGYSAWWLTLLALLGASLIHLGLNMLNDYFDTASGADDANVNPTPYSGGSRVLQYGLVTEKAMFRWGAGLIGAGSVIGVVLAFIKGPLLFAIGAVGLFLALFYTAPPIRLAYRGLGDLAVAVGFGPVVVAGSYFVASGKVSKEALYASIPVAILVMLILYVNQVPDRRADAMAGKRTLAVRLSPKGILLGYAASVVLAFVSIAVGVMVGVMPLLVLVALLPAPLAVTVYKGIRDNYDNPYGLMPAMSKNIRLHMFVGVALVAAYVAAAYIEA